MSRLDSFIRRLEAQRACIEAAVALVRDIEGPVIELGLGNGRTFDHLREKLPDREIFVFERDPQANPASRPDDAHLIVGDLETTLPSALSRLPSPAALAHSDIGTGVAEHDARMAAWLAEALPQIIVPGGIVASDQKLGSAWLEGLPLPDGVAPGRYFMYRKRTRTILPQR